MHVERHVIDVVTTTGGSAEVYTPTVTGRVASIVYQRDASAHFATGVDFTVSAEATAEAIWAGTDVNASVAVSPVRAATLILGDASTIREDQIHVANDRVKIVVSNGGNTRRGRFHVVVI